MIKSGTSIILLISSAILFVLACSPAEKIQSGTILQKYNPVDIALYNTIILQDSLLFEAFNGRNFEKFKTFFDNNLEIYQDNTGLRNYTESMEAFKGLFEGNYALTRKLVKSSVEIYPVKEYGAIETGQHTFCHTENGKLDCGTFKFVHIWQFKNKNWKITRIITYDHKL